ncbi:MAG: hypothetical protein VX899_20075 [Myxococcota bacterium]|nr:hypothetical protein [Myxococcota bacterium]
MNTTHRDRIKALRALSSVWYRDRSGVLRSDKVPGKAVVVQGRVRKQEGLDFLDRALRAGDLSFNDAEIYGDPGHLSLDSLLWTQGQALTNVEAIHEATHAILVVQANQSFFEYLPLSKHTVRLLRGDHKPWESLDFILKRAELDLKRIDRELGTLVAMGMVRLRAPGRKAPPRLRQAVARSKGSEQANSAQRQQVQRMLTERRLAQEWERMQAMDDYTLLGTSKEASPESQKQAALRMRKRYAGLARKPSLTPATRELAEQIQRRIEAAIKRMRSGSARTATHLLLESPEKAMAKGKELAAKREWVAAVTCFASASNVLQDDPDVQAWLGFAHFHDPRHDRQERQEKGREMVVLAATFGSKDALGLLKRLPEAAR